jgi:hypothetical protein
MKNFMEGGRTIMEGWRTIWSDPKTTGISSVSNSIFLQIDYLLQNILYGVREVQNVGLFDVFPYRFLEGEKSEKTRL